MPGYHIAEIPQGKFGELSKIYEEIAEVADADDQGATIMVIHELSDTIGAIQGYLERHHPTITLIDLITMSDITQRAFRNGGRASK